MLFPILSFPILYSISDKKLSLKEIKQKTKKKTEQNTKQGDYYELFETRSFGGERLNFFKNSDIICTQGEMGRIALKWRGISVRWRETADL